jgi:hypothetical protein
MIIRLRRVFSFNSFETVEVGKSGGGNGRMAVEKTFAEDEWLCLRVQPTTPMSFWVHTS